MLCDAIATHKLLDDNISPEYEDFLIKNEYIYECNENELAFYPLLHTKWDYPAHITNAIIEIGDNLFFIKKCVDQILNLGCRHFVFIFTEEIATDCILEVSELFHKTSTLTIEIYCKYSKNYYDELLENIMKENTRISYILMYGSPKDEIVSKSDIRGNIVFYSKSINYDECSIFPHLLHVNMPLYTESLLFNTFYNRKLCVDKNGNVKNYLTQEMSFGNIFSDNIEDIISKDRFKNYGK